MLKTYYYTEADLGIPLGCGGLRFDGSEERVDHAEDADLILVPPTILYLQRNHLQPQTLRYMKQWPEKHIFFDICDSYDCVPGTERSIIIRCVVDDDIMKANPRTLANPWPASDLKECLDYSDIQFAVSFVGWDSGPLRRVAAESCKQEFGDRAFMTLNQQFFAFYPDAEQRHMNASFKNFMRRSRVILDAPSIYYRNRTDANSGFVTYRFYEAMSAGRVPAFCGKKPILPFADRIPWDKCYIHIPSDNATTAGEHIARWLETHDAFDVGMQNRLYWEMWLDSTYWPRLHRILVEELLEAEVAV